jgi:hypothetical protein
MLTHQKGIQMCSSLFESGCQILQKLIWRSLGYLPRSLDYVCTSVTFCIHLPWVYVCPPVPFYILLLWDVLWIYFLSYVWKYFLGPCCRPIKWWSMNLCNSMRGPPARDRNMHAHCKLDTQHEVGTVQQVRRLPVMERERGIEGLLLVPVGGTPCHYRRIGVFLCGSSSLGDTGARRTIILV